MSGDLQPTVTLVCRRFNGKIIREIIVCTQAEYDAIPVKDDEILYMIVDE